MNKRRILIISFVATILLVTVIIVNFTKGLSDNEIKDIIKNCKSVRELGNVYFEQINSEPGMEETIANVWIMDNKFKNVMLKFPGKVLISDFENEETIVYDNEKKEGAKMKVMEKIDHKEMTDVGVRNIHWKYLKTEMVGKYECFVFSFKNPIKALVDVGNMRVWIDKKTNFIIKTENEIENNILNITEYKNISVDSVKSEDFEIPSDINLKEN